MRLDHAVVFGHGIPYIDEILRILRQYPDLELIYLKRYTPYDFVDFVEKLYSVDKVPIEHLRAKMEYLWGVGKDTYIMLIKNHAPEEKMVGEGEFQHIQCMLLNRFKWHVRERFNPQIEGIRSEHHVIHTSDYEEQTVKWLKLMNMEPLERWTKIHNVFPHLPFYIGDFNKYEVKKLKINDMLFSEANEGDNILMPLERSPHYQYVIGNKEPYIEYWDKWKGIYLWEDHSPYQFDTLISQFDTTTGMKYLDPPYDTHYIITKDNVVVDGVHRLSILKKQGKKTFIGVELYD